MPEDLKTLPLKHGRLSWQELGEGPPLVLLHGWAMSHVVFAEQAELLSRSFRLLIPDLPGHGGSDPVDPCSLVSIARILADWLEKLDIKQVNLLGWSLGGQVALQLSADFPDLVQRLVLLSSTPRFCVSENWSAGLPPGELRMLRRGIQKKYLATMGNFFDLQFKGEELAAERRREIIQFAVRPVGLPDPAVALSTLGILGQEDLRPLLHSIDRQTLVIHGENDEIIPHAAGQYLSQTLPNARFVSLPGIGHAPFLSCPELLARLVREFCR